MYINLPIINSIPGDLDSLATEAHILRFNDTQSNDESTSTVHMWDQVLRSLVDEARNLPAILATLSSADLKRLSRDVDFLQLDRTSIRGRRLGAHVLRVALEHVLECIRAGGTSSGPILSAIRMFERSLELFPRSIDECVGAVYLPQHGSVAKTKVSARSCHVVIIVFGVFVM
jgi:hypothetical protein